MSYVSRIFIILGLMTSSALALTSPYEAIFTNEPITNPREIWETGFQPGIHIGVDFGPFMNACDHSWYCQPPPEVFGVEVAWNSPNDPNCWWLVYRCIIYGEIPLLQQGHGHWAITPSTQPHCCQWSYIIGQGKNKYTFNVGPVTSGRYRVRLFTINWPLWDKNNCNPDKPNYMWRRCSWVKTGERFVNVSHTINDYSGYAQLYFVDVATGETIYNNNILNVMSQYYIYCKVRSTRSSALMPQNLGGWLYPEGALYNEYLSFTRFPIGDESPPCAGNPFKDYAYRSDYTYRPFDLWNLSPEEWMNLSRALACTLRVQGGIADTIGIEERVISQLHLEPVNDTTQAFIPAKGEKIDFKFIYSSSLNLNSNCRVLFRIYDESGRLKYAERVPIPDIQQDPNQWGLPDFPVLNIIRLNWDGRINQDIYNLDHLADPDASPFLTHVFVDEGAGMMTNIDTFAVIPSIDSILLTHSPSYPPPDWYDLDTIYCVIRGKIDDSNIPSNNYRYYIPPAQPPDNNPSQLGFWVNARSEDNYHFWDADIGNGKKYYFEYNQAQILPLSTWDIDQFGTLDYTWKVIHDKRQGGSNVNYAEIIDTTEQWGNTWRPVVFRPPNWNWPESRPYMRILINSEIRNNKYGYLLQTDTSALGKNAHKVIFGENTFSLNYDIVDWAVTHIGVPYSWGGKQPYEKGDCSALVTATKIQELESNNLPQPLEIHPINSLTYYNGSYGGQSITRKIAIDTLLRVPGYEETGGRGYLIFLRGKNDTSQDWINTRHIVIIDFMALDSLGVPQRCYVLNARGGNQDGSNNTMGRVRYDEALGSWPPYDANLFPDGSYVWTILKWEL